MLTIEVLVRLTEDKEIRQVTKTRSALDRGLQWIAK